MYLTISKFKQVLRSRKGLGKVSTTTLVSRLRRLAVRACAESEAGIIII